LKKYSTYILPLIGVLALLYVFFVPSEKNVKESAAVFSNYIIQQEKKFADALPALSGLVVYKF
jgi:hypothetical protein